MENQEKQNNGVNKAVEEKQEQKKSFTSKLGRQLAEAGLFFLELVKVAVLAAIVIVFIRHFLFKPFYVRGASMEPSFYSKEYLIIDELSYRFREPTRGEVVVFEYPDAPKDFFLKRLIGLPGERVKVSDGQVIIYNEKYPEGLVLKEEYLKLGTSTEGERTIVMKKDEYFVLGDNRSNSYDSRRFGAVVKGRIIGRAIFRGWPLNRIQILKSPEFDI